MEAIFVKNNYNTSGINCCKQERGVYLGNKVENRRRSQ